MAIKFTPIYTNEAEYIQALARSSDLFRNETYDYAVTQGQGEDYAYALAGTKTRESDSFVLQDYNLLSGQDQYMYLLNEYYIDKTETAIDEETGESYNVYERNKEYLDYKVQEAIDLQTYESLSGFERFFATIGGFIGNALNELFLGTIEGLVDLGATIVGQKDWAATDFTGVQANREALQRYARAYTYIDKNWFAGMLNDVTTGITKMAPLLIPVAGQSIYFAAMAGNTAEAAIRANPDIDYGSLLLYTAGTTALEFATEKISGKLFGTGKLVGGAKSGNFFTSFALDFASEGFEEAVAEIGGSLLYNMMVDPTAPIASFSDIMYAGLIGGLIGGIATTGRVAGTRGKTVLADGTVVDTKVAKQAGLDGKKLSKSKSLFLQESIADLRQQLSESNEMKLQAKYSKETLEQIKTNHAEEYKEAVAKDQELRDEMIKSSIGLSNILASAGVEGFTKATQLLDYQAATQERLLKNFVSKSTGVSAENRAVEEKFRTLANGESSFTVSDTLNATQQRIKDGIKKLYGKNVYFGNIGEQDGIMKRHGLTLDENTIILDINLTQNESIETVMEKVIKEELVHTLQFQSGILNAKTLKDLMDQYKQLGGETIRTEENVAYSQASELTKISEAQAKALAETLLFDKFTIARIFSTNRGLFNRIYNWLRSGKNKIEELKQRKTNKDKVKYKQLLKCMKTYRDSVAETIGNEQDANIAKAEMNLSDEELQELIDTYRPDYTNEHYTLLKSEYSLNTTRRRNAERLLSEARADINKLLPFSYRNVFNPEYYGTIKAQDGTDINFVEAIMQRNPDKDFKYNLQEFMIQETGFAINERTGSLMEVLDYNKVTTQDFDTTCAKLQQDPNALRKYNNLAQIFDKKFVDKFIDSTGFNELENVELRFVARSEKSNKQAEYVGLNPLTQKPMITVYMSENQTMSLAEINNFKHKLFHETTHALADIQGLPNGTSVDYVRSALKEMNSPQTVHRLAKLLLTNNFYNENKNNLDALIENVAYGIYAITDGEYAAEAYAESISRKGDMKVHLKAGYLMNRSGFTTDGLYLYGYGRFAGITLQANSIVQAKASYQRSALRKATEVVAYSKESGLNEFLQNKGVVDLEKAGFGYEFIDALTAEKLSEKTLLDLFNRNEIGSREATNIIIEWLTKDAPNKNIKTFDDILRVKEKGLVNAIVYNKARTQYDSNYDKNTPHSYEEVDNFISNTPDLKITTKNKKGETKTVPLEQYWFSQYSKTFNLFTIENSKANEIILKSDFDFSVNSTQELLRALRNNRITSETKEVAAEKSSATDDDSSTSSLDVLAYQQWEESEHDTGEKESPEDKVKRITNQAKKGLNDWFRATDKSGKTYSIKQELLSYKTELEQLSDKLKFSDVVSRDYFEEEILNQVLNTNNWEKIHKKLERHSSFIDGLFGEGTSKELRKQIRDVYKISRETSLQEIAKNIGKEKQNIEKKEYYNDFTRLHEESRELLKTLENSDKTHRELTQNVRERYSRSIRQQLRANRNRNADVRKSVVTSSSKGTSFTMYSNVASELFHDAFETIKPYTAQNELVDLHDDYNDSVCYLSEDGLQGFAVTSDGNLISVFNADPNKRGYVDAVKTLMLSAGATHLDCYGYLAKAYQKALGFQVASVMDYNMEYDHHNIAVKYDKPQVSFLVLSDTNVETKHFNKDEYDAAVSYQQSQINVSSETPRNLEIVQTLQKSTQLLSPDGENIDIKKARAVEDKVSVLTVSTTVQSKIDELKSKLPEESISDYSGDYNDPVVRRNSQKWIDANKAFLEKISPEELPQMIAALRLDLMNPQATAASNILFRYAYKNRYSQFNDISDWIKRANQIRTTEAAQQMGNSNALYGNRSTRDFIAEVQMETKQKIEFDDAFTNYVIKSFTGKDMSMDDFTNNIHEQLKGLQEQFAKSDDPVEGLALQDQIEKTTNLLEAANNNDIPAMIDSMNDIQQNDDTDLDKSLEIVDERMKQMMEYLVRHIEERNGTWVFSKEKALLSDKTKQKLSNFLAGFNSFRFMCMLSNPTTWAKNAISNTLSSAQAIIEDGIGGFFERRKWFRQDDTQVNFHGQYNEAFKEYVKKEYLPYIKKATQGDKYTTTEAEKMRNEYAIEKDPIRKVKILNAIKKAESVVLNDERWTQPRALRNLTRTLAGSHNLIYTQCFDWLVAKYRGNIDASKITAEELYQNISKKNGKIAELFLSASKGDMLSRVKLAKELKLDIVSTDPKVDTSIFNYSVYRANKLLLKIDNWLSRAISNARRKGGKVGKAVTGLLSVVMPFSRITVNSTMYMLDRSPIGLARGIFKLCQTKTAYRLDMITGIEDYYKSEYRKLLETEKNNYIKNEMAKSDEYYWEKDKKIKSFDYSEAKFNEWSKTNVPSEIQNAIKNKKDFTALKKVYDALVEQGKIPPRAIGANNPFMRANAIELLSQGALGTALLGVGIVLAALTDAFDYDDDEDYLGPVLKIGNFKIALDDISPFGSVFAIGAMLGSDNTDSRFLSAFKVFVDGSIFSFMDSALTYSDDTLDFFKNQFITTIQQVQPAITKNLAKTIYNTKKDKSDNLFWRTLKTIGSNSLIFNWLVPNKINPYTGEPERYYESGIIESIFGFVSPIRFRVETESELEKIAKSLRANTTGLTGRFEINNKNITVTGAEKEQLAKYRANYIQQRYSKISSGREKVTVENEKGVRITTTWDKLTNAQKKTILERIYSDASNKSKIKYWLDSGNTYRTSNQNEFNELKKLFKSGVEFRSNWNKSKFIER